MDQLGRSGVALNGGGSEDKPDGSAGSDAGSDKSRPGVPDGDRSVESPGVDVPGSLASSGPSPDPGGTRSSARPGVEGVEQSDGTPQGGESPGSGRGDDGDVLPGAVGNLGVPPVTLNIGGPVTQGDPGFELARRVTDLQAQQFQFQMETQRRELELRGDLQQQELDLRRQQQADEVELRRLVIERANENEKAAIQRLQAVDRSRGVYARRGQTFAMWLAGGATGLLIASGLAVVFLTVVGAVASSVGIPLAGILLAAGLIASISNLVKNFLPGGGSDDSDDSGKRSLPS
jgi:hypothetical protein